MITMNWKGVMPAITTCFDNELRIDHEFTARHVSWLIEHGCSGIVTNGSLGEGSVLTLDEKKTLWETCVGASGGHVPIVASIASAGTADAIKQARAAEAAGCRGLMVLPPYIYKGDWPEMRLHLSAIINATGLSCMLYNNPIAYGTDFLPEQIVELASEHENLNAIKESSGDVRRITAIRAIDDDRLAVFVGLDDAIVEGVNAGAVGWVAGLVNAFPRESVELFNLAVAGNRQQASELYQWFLPLLRLDVVPKFVQLIKLVQEMVGVGSIRVRPPRLELAGAELETAVAVIEKALKTRPIFEKGPDNPSNIFGV